MTTESGSLPFVSQQSLNLFYVCQIFDCSGTVSQPHLEIIGFPLNALVL